MKTFVRYCALAAVLSSASLSAQGMPSAPSEAKQLADAIAKAESGTVGVVDVETIAEARAVQTIPALERQFARATSEATKAKIAAGLVRLGDKDDTYWNYVEEQAALAVDSDIPNVINTAAQFKDRTLSPELQAWAGTHNVSWSTAALDATYNFPGKVLLMAETGDPRGIPLLRRALRSRNTQIVHEAAEGLVLIPDVDSIPLILAACQRMHADAAFIAEPLIWLNDSRAQTAVDTYMPKEQVTRLRDARARGMGVFGWNRVRPIP